VVKIEIKEWYEHEQPPSIFIMFRKNFQIVWSFSGNHLGQIYLNNPTSFISGPIEVPVPDDLYEKLDEYEDF